MNFFLLFFFLIALFAQQRRRRLKLLGRTPMGLYLVDHVQRSPCSEPVLCVLTYISYAVLQTQKKSGSAIYGRIDCDTFVTKSMTPKQKRKGS